MTNAQSDSIVRVHKKIKTWMTSLHKEEQKELSQELRLILKGKFKGYLEMERFIYNNYKDKMELVKWTPKC